MMADNLYLYVYTVIFGQTVTTENPINTADAEDQDFLNAFLTFSIGGFPLISFEITLYYINNGQNIQK